MKDQGGSSNIFDLAGKSNRPLRKKIVPPPPPPKKKEHSAPPPQKKEQEETTAEETPEHLKESSREVEGMLRRMYDLNKDLEAQLERLYQKSGLSPKDVEKLLRGLAGDDVDRIKKDQKTLEDKIKKALGILAVNRVKKAETKLTKKHKAKSVGARRHWIPTK